MYPKLYPLSVEIRAIRYEDDVVADHEFEPISVKLTRNIRLHAIMARRNC
jgi:hypothetical protein